MGSRDNLVGKGCEYLHREEKKNRVRIVSNQRKVEIVYLKIEILFFVYTLDREEERRP